MEVLATHIRERATWQRVEHSRGRRLGIDVTKSNGVSPALGKMLEDLEEKGRTEDQQ
jgi:hypothetical protein